jgi:hypothetical protein
MIITDDMMRIQEILEGSFCYQLQRLGYVLSERGSDYYTYVNGKNPKKEIDIFIKHMRIIAIRLHDKEVKSYRQHISLLSLSSGIENVDKDLNYFLHSAFFTTETELLGLLEYYFNLFKTYGIQLLSNTSLFKEITDKIEVQDTMSVGPVPPEMSDRLRRIEEQKFTPKEWSLDNLYKGKLKWLKKPKKKPLSEVEFNERLDHDIFWYHRIPFVENLEAAFENIKASVFKQKKFLGADQNPETIEEALDNMLDVGTESMLDIAEISDYRGPGYAFLVTSEFMSVLFGFSSTDWDKFSANMDMFFGNLSSGECLIIPLTENKHIVEYVFIGRTFQG